MDVRKHQPGLGLGLWLEKRWVSYDDPDGPKGEVKSVVPDLRRLIGFSLEVVQCEDAGSHRGG
ncbi:MAG: hypothetical protein Q9180_002287 [Flavoplaca navasiana]